MSDKWVRVMADYSSCGLWEPDGSEANEDDIPMSDGLRARLGAWCLQYEDNDDYLPVVEREGKFDAIAHAAEGLQIARALKAELPDWTVIYFDEPKCIAARGKDVPRPVYEYEVLAP